MNFITHKKTIKLMTVAMTLLSLSLAVGCKEAEKAPAAGQKKVDHSKMDHSKMDHSKMKPGEMDHSKHESMDAGQPTDMSIYNLESTWTNQDAKPLQLKSLSGKVQIMAMIYSSCKNACPRIIEDMKRIEAEVQEKYKDKVNLVLVSIDPKVDTPEKLKALAKKSSLTENWKLLRGDADDVMELAALLGVKYKKISDTDYAHSNILSLLNLKGEIVHQQVGLGVDPAQTIEAIAKLLPST